MSWKLILGLALVVAIIAIWTGLMIHDLGRRAAGRVWTSIFGITIVALLLGWLIGTGLRETFP